MEALSEVLASAASVSAIFAADTLSTPVWLLTFARAFAWLPRRRLAVLASRWGMVVTQLALALSWASDGRASSAVVVLAFLAGEVVALEVSTQLLRQRLELESEGERLSHELERLEVRRDCDRIARELHDGLAADLVALNFSLRRQAPQNPEFQERVRGVLEELRSVIWSLRGGRGSIAEFEKVVGARARTAVPGLVVRTSTRLIERSLPIEPEVALVASGALHAMLATGAPVGGLSAIDIVLVATPSFVLTVFLRGLSRDEIQLRVTLAREAVADVGTHADVAPLHEGIAVSVGPLSATQSV